MEKATTAAHLHPDQACLTCHHASPHPKNPQALLICALDNSNTTTRGWCPAHQYLTLNRFTAPQPRKPAP